MVWVLLLSMYCNKVENHAMATTIDDFEVLQAQCHLSASSPQWNNQGSSDPPSEVMWCCNWRLRKRSMTSLSLWSPHLMQPSQQESGVSAGEVGVTMSAPTSTGICPSKPVSVTPRC